MLDTENLVILSGRAIMDEALIFAIEHGIIDVAELQAQVEEMRKTEYSKNHDHAITRGFAPCFFNLTSIEYRYTI